MGLADLMFHLMDHWLTIFCSLYNIASGMCCLAQAIKRDAEALLKGVADKSTIEDVKHILEVVNFSCLQMCIKYNLINEILFVY